jgi:hypothetical protein
LRRYDTFSLISHFNLQKTFKGLGERLKLLLPISSTPHFFIFIFMFFSFFVRIEVRTHICLFFYSHLSNLAMVPIFTVNYIFLGPIKNFEEENIVRKSCKCSGWNKSKPFSPSQTSYFFQRNQQFRPKCLPKLSSSLPLWPLQWLSALLQWLVPQ